MTMQENQYGFSNYCRAKCKKTKAANKAISSRLVAAFVLYSEGTKGFTVCISDYSWKIQPHLENW